MAKKKVAAVTKKATKKAKATKKTARPTKTAKRRPSPATKKVATPRSNKLSRERGRITPPPPHDATKLIPALASRRLITVRLHPQRAEVPDIAASKLGGEILWPCGEPWPVCECASHNKNNRPTLVPILQLRKDDVPELGFPPGCDLFQLLWCPSGDHDIEHPRLARLYNPVPTVYWRRLESIVDVEPTPSPMHADESYVPKTCRLTPERVIEYPPPGEVAHEALAPLDPEGNGGGLSGVYQWELSACPGTKVGGYPGWVQGVVPLHCSQGHAMEFLLQLTDSEYTNVDEHPRWIPKADRWVVTVNRANAKKREQASELYNPAGFEFGHSVFYLFICRKCKSLPVTMYMQC